MHCVGKMKNTLSPMFAALALTAALAAPAQAQEDPVTGNAQAGSAKIAMCIGCHGIVGYKSSFPEVYRVPKISGQNAQYIELVLEGYRKADRKHPSMRGIAGSLTDQDIADVAAYYASHAETRADLPTPPAPRSNKVADLLQRGACVSCHGENYSSPIDPSYPKLAGQHPDYLYAALKAYRDDSHATWGRANPIMAGMVKQFSNPELKLIAQYIGSLPGELQTIPQSKFR